MKLFMNKHIASCDFGHDNIGRGRGLKISLYLRLALQASHSAESTGLDPLNILKQSYQL
jgi:hypothetical protein